MCGRANAVSIGSLGGLVLLLSACGASAPELRSPDGQFAPCVKRCVSSRSGETGVAVRPIEYSGTREAARAALLRLIAETEGAQVMEEREDYIHATFTAGLLRSVDDLELDFPPHERVVHVRAASRSGIGSGSARERVEDLRARFDALQP